MLKFADTCIGTIDKDGNIEKTLTKVDVDLIKEGYSKAINILLKLGVDGLLFGEDSTHTKDVVSAHSQVSVKKKKKDPSEEASRLFVLPLQPKEEIFLQKRNSNIVNEP